MSDALPSPVQFVRGLSDSLQPNRLEALKEVKLWMEEHGSSYEFTSVEIDQLWRALQLCLWMADKRPVQQQVAAETVLFGRKINRDLLIDWNRGFWFNIERIYETIDKYRIPKFHLLLRIYVAEMFHQAREEKFDNAFIEGIIGGFTANIRKSTGAYIHVLSVFLEELILTLGADQPLRDLVPEDAFTRFIKVATYVVDNCETVQLTLLKKACDSIVSDARVVQYSIAMRNQLKQLLQRKAKDKDLHQDARDVLYECMDRIDAVPVAEERRVVKKTKVDPVSEPVRATKKTKVLLK
jgi:hypothetical protein